MNRKISKIPYHSICYAHITNFRKHLWKHWLLVNFTLAIYAFTGYDFIGQIFINDISRYIEAFVEKCCTLAQYNNCSVIMYIFWVRIDRLSMFISLIYVWKTKTFIPIRFGVTLFWSLLLVENLVKQTRGSEHKCRTELHCKTVFAELVLLLKTSLWLLLRSSLFQLPYLSEFYISNSIYILVIITIYGAHL